MMYLDEVTPEQIERQGRKIDKAKVNEPTLTTITDTGTQRLWCAMNILAAKSQEARARAKTASTDQEEQKLESEAQQLQRLCKLARDLFWYEVNELVGWDKDVGVRDGWAVVKAHKAGGMHLLGGGGGLEGLKDFLEGL